MVHRILTEDLIKKWCITKLVPHILSSENMAIRTAVLFLKAIAKNLVTIDEKFFYCRKVSSRKTIGSWASAAEDEVPRTNMEKKYSWL